MNEFWELTKSSNSNGKSMAQKLKQQGWKSGAVLLPVLLT